MKRKSYLNKNNFIMTHITQWVSGCPALSVNNKVLWIMKCWCTDKITWGLLMQIRGDLFMNRGVIGLISLPSLRTKNRLSHSNREIPNPESLVSQWRKYLFFLKKSLFCANVKIFNSFALRHKFHLIMLLVFFQHHTTPGLTINLCSPDVTSDNLYSHFFSLSRISLPKRNF